jgi:hypothetical protein
MISELSRDGRDSIMKSSRGVLGIVGVLALLVGVLTFTGLGRDAARYWRILRM